MISGIGAVAEISDQLDRAGKKRAFVLTGNTLATKTGLVTRLEDLLGDRWIGTFSDCKEHVPASSVAKATEQAIEAEADAVVSLGGGSPTDTAKHVTLNLLEERLRGEVLQAILPTTLSAGEFTFVAGITNEETGVKKGRVDHRGLPSLVILDPELTVPTPERLWSSTGVKALDHAIETVWSPRAHPVSDTLALEAIARLRRNIEASMDPSNLDARLECQLAAWMSIFGMRSLGGFRLSHAIGHQVGGRWGVPHGITSCVILPEAMRFLAEVTKSAQAKIARAMDSSQHDSSDAEAAAAAPGQVENFVGSLNLPRRLSEVGAVRHEIPEVARAIADELQRAKSPDAKTATEDALATLLNNVW